jgi:DNA polymerase III subunit epsilon
MQLQLSMSVADRLHETLLVRGEPLDAVEAVRILIASPSVPAPLCQEILGALVFNDRRFCWDADMTGQLSLRNWEIPDPDLADVPFVALDLETTGARAGTEKITEIGAVRIEGFREVRRFSTLVNPMRPIPRMITQITGITQEMVAGAPRIEEVIPELLEFLEGAVVVAHNAQFDVGFLNYELHRLKGRRLGEGAIDTLPLARALAPGLPNYRLHTVAEALDAPVAACHRALADAQAAGHVFITLVGRLQEQGITRLGEVRAYVNPSSRSTLEKLHLTRDLPKCPGTYRFVDKDGHILYIGKADRLGERVRSHFVASADHARKVRQAVRLVERIDWDEACTPLEAIVQEQQLILEHRPSCNLHGTHPETYAYIKAGGPGPGLNLFVSGRAPKWLDGSDRPSQSARQPLTIGPFRGRSRLHAALDLLQRCYPIRRCPRQPGSRPCARGVHSHCLAPCTGDPETTLKHDTLVIDIVRWLAGQADVELPDPMERAEEVVAILSRQRRYEEAQTLREASEHLLSIRRSYASLAEARGLRFATLWPQDNNGDGPSVRLNLVWNGRLCEPVSLLPDTVGDEIEAALASLWSGDSGGPSGMAVPQKDLDILLAIRRWFCETEHASRLTIPGPESEPTLRQGFMTQLVAEARDMLLTETPSAGKAGAAI